jgi:hypothetical protein
VASTPNQRSNLAKMASGVAIITYLVFLLFGDRLGAISTGEHAPIRLPTIVHLAS